MTTERPAHPRSRRTRWWLLVAALILLVITGLWPISWIEEMIARYRLERMAATITGPESPAAAHADVVQVQDGWVVILYSQSRWTGHNLWNWHLARTSDGSVWESTRHFCVQVRVMAEAEASQGMPAPDRPPQDVHGAARDLLAARHLADIEAVLPRLGFTRRPTAP
jgi:hypothetical protein